MNKLNLNLGDVSLEIDDKESEEAKQMLLGRKNSLFSTSDMGAKAAVNLYSLIEMVKVNNL